MAPMTFAFMTAEGIRIKVFGRPVKYHIFNYEDYWTFVWFFIVYVAAGLILMILCYID